MLRSQVNWFARIAHVIAHSEQKLLASERRAWQESAVAWPASSDDRAAGAAAWSAFWRTGARDGCTAAFPAAAQAAIASAWHQMFATQSSTIRLLDVACGRGAVLAHAAAAGIVDRTGVDLAEDAAVAVPDERILGGVDACALPFADRSFDLVVSQFGLEYAGIERALPEAARVTRGALAFLVHAREGAVVAQAREQAAQAQWIDAERDGFGVIARGALDCEALLAEVDAAAQAATNPALLLAFADHARALSQRPDRLALDAFAAEWRAHAARMADLDRAAPDAAALDRAAQALGADGFTVMIDDLHSGGALVGRWLRAVCGG